MSHAHHHHHDHSHGDAHEHRRAAGPARSLLRASAWTRLGLVGACVAGLWAAVFWAVA